MTPAATKRKVWIIPHSHYDAEVFLVESETLEIGYANLLGALQLLHENPFFRFTLDQTCFVAPFLKTYPEQKEFLQKMVAEGRLEIAGGMVSMPDENMPSGESFIRNVLYGKRYFEQELGVDVRSGWPIDTFGHHPQIPQLMVKCGFDDAAFQRLMKKGSPSEFYWQGIDGTRLLCHWMPRSYAVFSFAPANLHEFTEFAQQRLHILEQYAVTPNLMAPAGADLSPVEPQLLKMVADFNQSQADYELLFATPAEYFRAIKDDRKGRDCFAEAARNDIRVNEEQMDFPVVTDDLNPAFQGGYSARIDIKQWNRKLETLLVDAEKLSAIARQMGGLDQDEKIAAAWQGVLFNQSHDIMCGCHIDAVYTHTVDRFKVSEAIAQACLDASLQTIVDRIDTRGDGIPIVLFNPLSWDRSDAVECTVAYSEQGAFALAVLDSAGNSSPCDILQAERYEDGSLKRAKVLFIARDVLAFGYEVFHIVPAQAPAPASDLATSHPDGGLLRFELDNGWLENTFYRLEFDLWNGLITRIYDKANQWEVLAPGKPMGNMVFKERDYGNFWQYNGPCKGDEFYPAQGRYPLPELNDKTADFAHTYLGDGNIRQGHGMVEFTISHPFGAGQVATRVRLYAGLRRIDIQTSLVNNDEKVRYRVAFPTSIEHSAITYEIPFGAIQRPEGEFPAQNWIDAANDQHGLTLVNRGLPGNNVVDGVMMLSLLKCTNLEGGYGDLKLGPATQEAYEKGITHTFDYALVPHGADCRPAQAARQGAEFNVPLIVQKPAKKAGSLPAKMSFLRLSAENVILSAVKPCSGGIIVRLYEAAGQEAAPFDLELAWPVKAACEVNLIEKDETPLALPHPSNHLALTLKPFEIKTLKLLM